MISSSYVNSNWSYSPERLSWVVTSVTLTFDLWPWPFAWTSLLSLVITPENFVMIQWWEHKVKKVWQTDRQTDGQTDGWTDRRTENTVHRAAWLQLKDAYSCISIIVLHNSENLWWMTHRAATNYSLNTAHHGTTYHRWLDVICINSSWVMVGGMNIW